MAPPDADQSEDELFAESVMTVLAGDEGAMSAVLTNYLTGYLVRNPKPTAALLSTINTFIQTIGISAIGAIVSSIEKALEVTPTADPIEAKPAEKNPPNLRPGRDYRRTTFPVDIHPDWSGTPNDYLGEPSTSVESSAFAYKNETIIIIQSNKLARFGTLVGHLLTALEAARGKQQGLDDLAERISGLCVRASDALDKVGVLKAEIKGRHEPSPFDLMRPENDQAKVDAEIAGPRRNIESIRDLQTNPVRPPLAGQQLDPPDNKK